VVPYNFMSEGTPCLLQPLADGWPIAPAVDDQTVIRDRKIIVNGYLKTWFVPDFISVIPFDLLLTSTSYGFMKLVKVRLIPLLLCKFTLRSCRMACG
jgi:hypothetical protein